MAALLQVNPLPAAEDFLARHPTIGPWIIFSVAALALYVFVKLFGRLVLLPVLRRRHVEIGLARFVRQLFVFFTMVVGLLAVSGVIFRVNLTAIVAGLGLATLALGFGLQNTIANLAGGVSLAIDKPFRIGDQIQVGEYTGDVQEIGLRSTRILTRRNEYVVFPNKLLEEQAIVNFTLQAPDLRVDLGVPISYSSDWHLAEKILVEVASAHPAVLYEPPPKVLVVELGESSVNLELRCWVARPRERRIIQSDLLKSIKDRFEREGVLIPFPHRVLVEQKELPAPAKLVDGRAPRPSATAGTDRLLLVPVPDVEAAYHQGPYAVSLAKALRANLIGLYVEDPRHHEPAGTGSQALNVLQRLADRQHVWFKPILRVGRSVPEMIVEVAQREDVDLVVSFPVRGGPEWRLGRRKSFDLAAFLRARNIGTPTHAAEPGAKIGPELVRRMEEDIAAHRKAKTASTVAASPDGEPKTS